MDGIRERASFMTEGIRVLKRRLGLKGNLSLQLPVCSFDGIELDRLSFSPRASFMPSGIRVLLLGWWKIRYVYVVSTIPSNERGSCDGNTSQAVDLGN